MKNKAVSVVLGAAALLVLPAQAEAARERIWATGSSTVYPFATMVAEQLGQKAKLEVPVVESLGTGGGIKLFCEGVGEKFPDLANASRAIKDSEKELCAKNGVKDIHELKFGMDGIVVANSHSAKHFDLTKKDIFLALAKQVPVNGALVANPYKKWSDINKALPDVAISVYGPPPTSGTRDAFVEMVMVKGCDKLPEFEKAYPDKKAHEKACGVIREDGAYVEAGENDNLIIQKLVASPDALGIFGYSFLEENQDKVQGSSVEGIAPTADNVTSGKYPVSRALFIYLKGEHVKLVKGLKAFAQELSAEGTIGNEGYLTEKGLIPLSKEGREKLRKLVQGLPQ